MHCDTFCDTHCDMLWHNAHLMTLDDPAGGLGVVRDGVVAARAGRIVYAGAAADAPRWQAAQRIDCDGRWISPGLIDCHTHLVYAGNRAGEFEQRLTGVSYAEIAQRGGGILSTVRATREASLEALVAASLPRLDAMLQQGVTTVEIKSGYGLTWADERKLLLAAAELGRQRAVEVVPTFLGAHALPPGRTAADYLDEVCNLMIPAVAAEGLAEAVDVFCEHIAFSRREAQRVFAAARRHGLKIKMHAEQLSNQHGAALAAEYGALSADHLEYLDAEGVAAMARAGTVAVLLPGAFYCTGERQLPPLAALRAAGVPLALASDCNPGTSPLTSPLLAMNLAATLFGMTVTECIAGWTREAARALGRFDRVGRLAAGLDCHLAIWEIEAPVDLVWPLGMNLLHGRVFGEVLA